MLLPPVAIIGLTTSVCENEINRAEVECYLLYWKIHWCRSLLVNARCVDGKEGAMT